MSTSETDDYDLGPCPCGAGNLTKTVTTQDNPWSKADISYRIDCAKCSSEWTISQYGRPSLTQKGNGAGRKTIRIAGS